MSLILTALGWLTETFFASLIQKAGDFAIQRWFCAEDDDGDGDRGQVLDELKNSLLTIQLVISKVESMWIHDETWKRRVNELLLQLKDAAYDADDFLDELQYRALQQQIEQQGAEASDLSSSSSSIPPRKKMKTSSSNAARSFFGKGDDKVHVAIKVMKEIQRRLDSIAANIKEKIAWIEADGRGKELTLSSVSRKTSSLVETQLFGRETELDKLRGLLSKLEDRSNNGSISILTIVGIGGVGKTTLVQEAYNKLVEGCFGRKFWVCVSENFNEDRLAREMIESIRKKKCDLMNFDALQSVIKDLVNSERFLLVLDDVWDLDSEKWEKFCAPLRFGAPGSKILITTRFKSIADIVGSADLINLHGLDEKSFWEYFEKCAFVSQKFGDYPELEGIAKRNIYKLKGLPLAARTLGGLLNQNKDKRHWESILESEMWKLHQKETDVLPVLQLSYLYLPTHLKRCFAFCSLFPKDFKFKEGYLVKIWMAEGFISPQEDMRMEDTGRIYFHELVNRSFFQQSQDEGLYVIHDLIHDLAELISRGECCRIEGTNPREIPSMIRHVSMFRTKLQELNNYSKLRTFILMPTKSEPISLPTYHTFLERLKRINVLVLQFCKLQVLPESFGNLIYLRYLDISFNKGLIKLPESLCKLYNLQTLKIQDCHPRLRLPHSMSKLTNLREIFAEQQIISTISEIGKLTSLQNLSQFRVLKEQGHKIEELNHLTQLRGMLKITNLENIVSGDEAKRGQLNNKKYLDILKLQWAPPYATNLEMQQLVVLEEVLEALQPHPTLENLTIEGYQGARSPSWLKAEVLHNLKTLALINCKRWKDLLYIAELPYLKVLHIKGIPVIKQINHQFCGPTSSSMFLPVLEELVLEDLLVLEEIPNIGQLPSLKILRIKRVPSLKYISHPSYDSAERKNIPILEELVLEDLLALEELPYLGKLPCLKVIRMMKIPAVKYFGYPSVCDATEGKFFPMLEKLVLEELLALEEIHNLGQLSCLKMLRLKRMPLLKYIGHQSCGSIEWKNISLLGELVLEDLPALKEIPNLGELPSLVVIELRKISSLKCIDHLLYDFPLLQNLVLEDLLALEEIPTLGQLPLLKYLHIGGVPKLKMITQGFFGAVNGKCFPRLKELHLKGMLAWEEWSWPKDQSLFPCLDIFYMHDCPKLKRLPPLPYSLQRLTLWEVGLAELPELCKENESSSNSITTPCLSFLRICDCPNLTSLEEGLLVHAHHLPNIKSIEISECEELRRLPAKSFKELTSLKTLAIRRCPKLTPQDETFDLLPPFIKCLESHGYGDLDKFQPSCLNNLISSLTQLLVGDYPKLVSFPRVFFNLTKLKGLSIVNCDELKSIEGLGNLKSLERLTIKRCPKLLPDGGSKHGESLLSLISLRIDNTRILKLVSARETLPAIRELTVTASSQDLMFEGEDQELLQSLTALEMLHFDGCVSIQFLPTKLHTLSSLRSLVIRNCPQVESLPEKGLPESLTNLFATKSCHPTLQKQSQEYFEKMK